MRLTFTSFVMRNTIYRASLRALWIADSVRLPEAECSFGIGTAMTMPVLRLSFIFASEIIQLEIK